MTAVVDRRATVECRLIFLAGVRRYTGAAARRLAKSLAGQASYVCDIRQPALGVRGALLRRRDWPVRKVVVGNVVRRIGNFSVAPFGCRESPGLHTIHLLDAANSQVRSTRFEVHAGKTTVVTIFPPTTALLRTELSRPACEREIDVL